MEPRHYTDALLARRILQQARPYAPHLCLIFLLQLLATPLALLMPLPLKIAVDSVLGSDPLPAFLAPLVPEFITASSLSLLIFAVSMQVIVVLLSQLQSLACGTMISWTGEHLVLGFRARIFNRIQHLSLSFHDTRGIGDLIYRVQYDAPAIERLTIGGVIPLVSSVLTLLGMIYITVQINLELALVALIVCPALYLATNFYSRYIRPLYRNVKNLESSALKLTQESFGAIRLVKAFSAEDREQQRFKTCSTEGLYARVWIAFLEGVFGLCVGVVVAIGTATALFIGIRSVQAGTLSLGELLIVISYMGQLLGPLQTLSRRVARLQSHLTSTQRAFEVLDESLDVLEKPSARPLTRASGTIEFRDVTFGYESHTPILKNVKFAVPQGKRVGIAGSTGIGKTTLVSLIIRFYDPDEGQILLDGVDLRDYKLADLRNQFAIVLQDPVLFSTSIAENIAYGNPDANEAQIIEAATAANAHEFITSFSDGYNTPVGERGMKLSGGERQRISLARAFLKKAPILIFDEPTSSVDIETEADIAEAMDRLTQGCTTFMIAHRVSTLKSCDMLLVFENGQPITVSSNVRSAIRRLYDRPNVGEYTLQREAVDV